MSSDLNNLREQATAMEGVLSFRSHRDGGHLRVVILLDREDRDLQRAIRWWGSIWSIPDIHFEYAGTIKLRR